MDKLLTKSLSDSVDTRRSRDTGQGFRSVDAEMTVGGVVTVRDREVERLRVDQVSPVPTLAPPLSPRPLSTWPLFGFSSDAGSS